MSNMAYGKALIVTNMQIIIIKIGWKIGQSCKIRHNVLVCTSVWELSRGKNNTNNKMGRGLLFTAVKLGTLKGCVAKGEVELTLDVITPLNSITDGFNITNDLIDGISSSEYWSSIIPCFVADSVGNKKTNHRRSYKRWSASKNNSRKNFIDGIILSVFSTIITYGKPISDYGMGGKYLRTLCKIPMEYSVGNSNGKHRWNISVGDCGMGGNFFATLGKISTAWFRL